MVVHMTTDTDLDLAARLVIARVRDEVFKAAGHRVSPRLVRRLRASSRWEIALAFDHDRGELLNRIVKGIAFQQLSDEHAS